MHELVWVKNQADPGSAYHNYECTYGVSKQSSIGRVGFSPEDAVSRGYVACGKCRPASNDRGPGNLFPDNFPDYVKSMPEEDRQAFLKACDEWKPEFDAAIAASSTRKFKIALRPLTEKDMEAFLSCVEEVESRQTRGKKTYVSLKALYDHPKSKYLAVEFFAYGEKIVGKINLADDLKLVLLKNKALALVNWGKHMPGCPDFKRAEFEHQLAHLDVPAPAPGKKKGLYSAFLSLTRRAETAFYFDMSLEQIMGGRKWTQGTDEDKRIILWRLCYAHIRAFELQVLETEAAVKNGDWKSCEAGTVHAFDPTTKLHAGQPALKASRTPEVFLLFEYADKEIAPHYDEHLDVDGGFGQHAWHHAAADVMLKRVEQAKHWTPVVSLYLSLSAFATCHHTHPTHRHWNRKQGLTWI